MKKLFALLLCVCILAFSFDAAAISPEDDYISSGIIEVELFCGDGEETRGASVIDCSGDLDDATRAAVREYVHGELTRFNTTVDLSRFMIPAYYVGGKYYSVFTDIFSDVANYYPDVFYTRQYSYSMVNIGGQLYITEADFIVLSGYDEETYNEQMDYSAKQIQKIISGIPEGALDIQKIVYVHDYMDSHFEYDLTYSIYDMYNLLYQKTGVCQAYTLTFKAIMDELGIECHTSISRPDNHIWNVVKLGGNYYYIDCTNDDPVSDRKGCASHDNLLMSATELATKKNHSEPINIPYDIHYSCDAADYDYCAIKNSQSAVFIYNGEWYGMTYGLPQRIIKYSADFKTSTEIAEYRSGYASGNWAVGAVLIGKDLYFNDAVSLVKYDFESGAFQSVATAKDFVRGCFLAADGRIGIFSSADSISYLDINMGDLDGDSMISATDIAVLKHYILGYDTDYENIFGLADLNRDNKVDLLDCLRYKFYVAGAADFLCG